MLQHKVIHSVYTWLEICMVLADGIRDESMCDRYTLINAHDHARTIVRYFFFAFVFLSAFLFRLSISYTYVYHAHIGKRFIYAFFEQKKNNVAQLTCLNRAVIRSNYTLYTQRTHRLARSTCAKSSLFHHQFFHDRFIPLSRAHL